MNKTSNYTVIDDFISAYKGRTAVPDKNILAFILTHSFTDEQFRYLHKCINSVTADAAIKMQSEGILYDENEYEDEYDYEDTRTQADKKETDKAIVKDILKIYLAEINRYPQLSREEEEAILKKLTEIKMRHPDISWQNFPKDDKKEYIRTRDELVKANLSFVVSFVRKYSFSGLPLPDLIQEGNRGLVKAIEYFDLDAGSYIRSYAMLWIKHYVNNAIATQPGSISLSVSAKKSIRTVKQAQTELEAINKKAPSLKELAEHLRMSEEKVAYLLTLSAEGVSLNAAAGTDKDLTLNEVIADPTAQSPETQLLDSFAARVKRRAVRKALSMLHERERVIIELSFGLDNNGDQRTHEEVAKMLGMSNAKVAECYKEAMYILTNHPEINGVLKAALPINRNKPAEKKPDADEKTETNESEAVNEAKL